MEIDLTGQTVIVTGCSRGGLGQAIAERFAADGANLVLTARSEGPLAEMVASLSEAGPGRVVAVAGQLADADLPARLRAAADELGGAGILINNAGIFPAIPLADTTSERIDEVMGCNFTGMVALCREFVPAMAARGGGSVVNVTSIAARVPIPGMALYTASKAAVEAFSRSIAAEFAPRVRVNCVSPGPMLTEETVRMMSADSEGVTDTVTKGIPMQRLGSPAEVAEAVHFLATQRSSWTTGEVLQVNGGGYMG